MGENNKCHFDNEKDCPWAKPSNQFCHNCLLTEILKTLKEAKG